MKKLLPLLAVMTLVVLLSNCMRKLTSRNIVLVDHLERVALLRAAPDCRNQDQDCEEFKELVDSYALEAVARSVANHDLECEEPPCDWPDTMYMAIIPDLLRAKNYTKPPELPALRFFDCEEPPCDWPDTLRRIDRYDFRIGITKVKNRSIAFQIVDTNGEVIATEALEAQADRKSNSVKAGDLVRTTFRVVNPNFSGHAEIIMKRTEGVSGKEQEFRIPARIYNPQVN